MSDEIIVSGL